MAMRRPAAAPKAMRRPAAAPKAAVMRRPAASTSLGNVSVESWTESLGLGNEADAGSSVNSVYLVTFARVLANTLATRPDLRDPASLEREEIRQAVLDAFENPMVTSNGGRPRVQDGSPLVLKMIIAKELHADGTVHFHVAVKLASYQRFETAKRTLLVRHGLPSHWSSNHTQWWSIVRYLTSTSTHKSIDAAYLKYAAEGVVFDTFEDANEPFVAKAWTGRREKKDMNAEAEGQGSVFTKLDFNALVIDKRLQTKKRVLAYVQDCGTASMQSFCSKHQRRLKEFLEDAVEWDSARAAATFEARSDWEVLCAAADTPCPDGQGCSYATAAAHFFDANKTSFSAKRLAVALRAIIMGGPSKDNRVPFLVGATNTGKSTIVESFDELYGEDAVFHLPAETDDKGGALRGWMQDKRFVFWDEFEPVVFVAKGVMPKSQFLKAFNGQTFEIQMNQRTNDGNAPFKWKRGAVFTAKEKGLWTLQGKVTEEDVGHMKNRVDIFRCVGTINRKRGGVAPCKCCMAKWIFQESMRYDADLAIMATQPALSPNGEVIGLENVFERAHISSFIAAQLKVNIVQLGAVDVCELGCEDWVALAAWNGLREMEKRRILGALGFLA